MDDYFQGIKITLLLSSIIKSFEIIRERVGTNDGYIRIKCELINLDVFVFSIYAEKRADWISIENYSYHWQSVDDKTKYRWDNTPHHPELKTFPAHVYIGETNQPSESTLNELVEILKFVKQSIESQNLRQSY